MAVYPFGDALQDRNLDKAAGVACVYALVVTLAIHREIGLRGLIDVAADSVYLTAQIFIIVAAAGVYSWLLTVTGAAQLAIDFIDQLDLSAWLVLLAINVFLLIVGAPVRTGTAARGFGLCVGAYRRAGRDQIFV